MDATTLQTASTYINNLLLARGLLRNGAPVEFMQLVRKKEESNAALGQVINLVHDLILRRDKEQSLQEDLVASVRALETESHTHASTTERLTTRNKDLQRQLVQAQTQARNAQTTLNTAEAAARTLRDEMVRVKSTLVQVRKQCENEVRKRDVQLQRLKTHLTAQQRGSANKVAMVAPSITLQPDRRAIQAPADEPSLEDTEYSLRQETNEFLTQLSQNLSTENDHLLDLVRSTVSTLRELQGIQQQTATGMAGVHQSTSVDPDGLVEVVPASVEALATDLESVLSTLRDLLTNPSFAPIEEVQSREEEIIRLRQGWEKMEGRWQEAVSMMQGWLKRMLSGGDTVNLEEIRMGLGLGNGFDALASSRGAFLHADDSEDESHHSGKNDIHNADAMLRDLPSDEEEIPANDGANEDLFDLPSATAPLKEVDHNVGTAGDTRKGSSLKTSKVPRKATVGKAVSNATAETVSTRAKRAAVEKAERTSKRIRVEHEKVQKPVIAAIEYEPGAEYDPELDSDHEAEEQHSHLSVREKLELAASEAQKVAMAEYHESTASASAATSATATAPAASADASTTRTKTNGKSGSTTGMITKTRTKAGSGQTTSRTTRSSNGLSGTGTGTSTSTTRASAKAEPSRSSSPLDLGGSPDGATHARKRKVEAASPVKRTRISGRPMRRRRKSTLSPEELEGLLMGAV